MMDVLVVVPCGSRKIWGVNPHCGSTRAADAYTSGFFSLNRQYAERYSDARVVLSAKYGFIEPDFQIPGPYEITFNRANTGSIESAALRQQVEDLCLHRYGTIVGLGGAAYREAISLAFAPFPVRTVFPFAGLLIGRMLQATKRSLQNDDPGFDVEG